MKTLKRIRYDKKPAYNLKMYNVIDNDIRSKVYEMMECDNFYDDINLLIDDFSVEHKYEWQAGFGGRSSGYLILLRGGRRLSVHKSYCTVCFQRNFTSVKETGTKCGKCGENTRIDKVFYETYTYPYQITDDSEVPTNVLRSFRRLAVDIVKSVENAAREMNIVEKTYTVEKKYKIMC